MAQVLRAQPSRVDWVSAIVKNVSLITVAAVLGSRRRVGCCAGAELCEPRGVFSEEGDRTSEWRAGGDRYRGRVLTAVRHRAGDPAMA